jgi:phage/plasmid-like protein (TIGR03299 family)
MSDYFESGFTVRERSWHGKETVHDDYPKDWAQAREWAGLTWEPVEVPIAAVDFEALTKAQTLASTLKEGHLLRPADLEVLRKGLEASQRLDDFKGVARNDTNKMLTVRTGAYQIINHEAMGEIVEAILQQPNVKYDTAGSVREGKQVWALVYLDEPITIPGDNSITLPYLAITNTHDGTGSCKANSTTVKIVCANTFAASEVEGERNGTIFTFPHKGSWRDRIDEARETITGLRRDFNAYVETAGELLKVRVNESQKELFVTQFIPAPPESMISDRVLGNVETARATLRTILASPTSDGIGDTAWGLVQAAGEYLDHYRQVRTMDGHYTRQLLRPEPLKHRAINLVREVVNA